MDSRDTRASAIGLGLAALLVLPSPGTLDPGDRQQVTYCYRGIQAGPPVAVTVLDICDTSVRSLVPSRSVSSLMPTRTVRSRNPVRTVESTCS